MEFQASSVKIANAENTGRQDAQIAKFQTPLLKSEANLAEFKCFGGNNRTNEMNTKLVASL